MSNVEPSENDDLWCAFCLDDPSVEICAFCGCKKCYGKFDPDLLILCDHCERETHCYCMEPPLAGIPDEDPWYCEACKVDIDQDEETQHKTHVEEKKEVKMPSPSSQPLTTTDSLQSQYEEGHQTPTKGKKFLQQLNLIASCLYRLFE